MTILDHRGRPVTAAGLEKEHGRINGDWSQEDYEPETRRLTPDRLGRLLRLADEGDPGAYLTLAEEIEEKNHHYRSVIFTRKSTVSGAALVVAEGSDDSKDQEIADAVKEHLLPHLPELIFEAMDAISKGFSVNEILWDCSSTPWRPRGVVWRDPRRFSIDPITGDGIRLTDGGEASKELPPGKYLVHRARLKSGHPIRGGLARLGAISFVAKAYTGRDLQRFLEVYGIPARIGRYAGERQPAKDQLRQWHRELSMIGGDATALLPDSVKVEILQHTGRGGPEGFVSVHEFWDRLESKLVLGQTMTTDDGASHAQARTHETVRIDYARHDARGLSMDITRQLVRFFVDVNWGARERYPRVNIDIQDKEALSTFSKAVLDGVDRGLKVSQADFRERLGLPDPKPDADMLVPLLRENARGNQGPEEDPKEPADGGA